MRARLRVAFIALILAVSIAGCSSPSSTSPVSPTSGLDAAPGAPYQLTLGMPYVDRDLRYPDPSYTIPCFQDGQSHPYVFDVALTSAQSSFTFTNFYQGVSEGSLSLTVDGNAVSGHFGVIELIGVNPSATTSQLLKRVVRFSGHYTWSLVPTP
jgi:hypothetical protein